MEHLQLAPVEAVLPGVHDERQVELTVAKPFGEDVTVVGLEQLDLEVGAVSTQGPHHAGEHGHRDALEGADGDAAELAGEEAAQVVLGAGEGLLEGPGVVEEQLARRGERNRTRAPGTVEHGGANGALDAAICWLTADWVYPSRAAARPNEPSWATARRAMK